MSDLIDRSLDRGVLWLTLNRPDRRNAVSPEMREELLAALDDARADDAVRCVAITGAGDAFCAGVDLSKSKATATAADGAGTPAKPKASDPEAVKAAMKAGMQRVIRSIWTLEKPVVAAVNGVAAGGGAQLALACDLTIAAASARFIEIFAKRGLAVDSGGGFLLPRLVGLAKAKELVFFAEPISAADAAAIGLINKVVPDATLRAEAAAWAERLAAGATKAIGASKRLLNRSLSQDLEQAFEDEAQAQADTSLSEDFAEGVRAFLEKRDPKFLGR